jgi:hypothetical protein
MSAKPPPTSAYPEPTQADLDAMFASVVWFRAHRAAGAFEKYAGMHVAVLGELVIDADREEHELVRRLEALGDSLPPNRVVTQYVPGPDDWFW